MQQKFSGVVDLYLGRGLHRFESKEMVCHVFWLAFLRAPNIENTLLA